MKSALILVLSCLVLTACNVKVGSSDDSNNSGNSAPEVTYGTYEMIEGCTTGVKKVNGANEAELKAAFCNMLKDNSANGNCASYQREAAFKTMQCEGSWPHISSTGYNVSSTQSYSYRVNSCSTGFHYFSSSNHDLGQKAYCQALLDDGRNQNCAREKRQEQFNESGCKL